MNVYEYLILFTGSNNFSFPILVLFQKLKLILFKCRNATTEKCSFANFVENKIKKWMISME